MNPRQTAAKLWFEALRDSIVAAFEALEAEAPAALYPGEPGRFTLTPWTRAEGGGGVMGMLKGRLFEKCGVHVSYVDGPVTGQMAQIMPGMEGRRFVATGLSVIAHLVNPRIPAVHMNTRFISVGDEDHWFGGGADLTPLLETQRHAGADDAVLFHAALKAVCDAYEPDAYEKYRAWCEEYFYLPHRAEPRGVGGIFYDRLNSGDFDRDFAFTKSVGEAFAEAYPTIARHRMDEPWTAEDREEQLIRRGRYVEFNLLYDRGTTFGLKTGGNVASILSSLPPIVKWP